jgi:hypothetical protein
MAYVEFKECAPVREIGKRPYRVTYVRKNRQRVKHFSSFDQARGFRSRLPYGTNASIDLVTKELKQ